MAARPWERTEIRVMERKSLPAFEAERPLQPNRASHASTGGLKSARRRVDFSPPVFARPRPHPLSARWVRFEFRTDVSAPVSAYQRSSTNVSAIGSHERAFGKTGHFRTFSDLGVHRDSITCNNPLRGFHIPCSPRDLPFAIFSTVARRCILLHAAPAISKCSPAVAPAAHTLHTIPPRTFPPKSAGDIQGIPAAALTNASSP
jgi:hypothetical protein